MVDKKYQILKRQKPWRDAYYYQKSEVLYQLTYVFCQRFLPAHGDRTVDQMVQAARSGKQNIIEGTEDGETSTEMHVKLMNVARSSLQELREDYEDYLRNHGNQMWDVNNRQCRNARAWCKEHSAPADYMRVCQLRNDITLANIALVLIHQTDFLLRRLLDSDS